jgi:hypothetical protein
MENVQDKLNQLALEEERVQIHSLAINEWERLPQLVKDFVEEVRGSAGSMMSTWSTAPDRRRGHVALSPPDTIASGEPSLWPIAREMDRTVCSGYETARIQAKRGRFGPMRHAAF